MSVDFGVNQGLVEEMFLRWAENPSSVGEAWRRFFDELPQEDWPRLTSAGTLSAPVAPRHDHEGVARRVAPAKNGAQASPPALPPADPSVYLVPTEEQEPSPVPAVELRTSFPPTGELLAATELQARLSALINAYRVRGHLYADLDPLGLAPKESDEFLVKRYGLDQVDPDTVFSTGDLAGPPTATLREILERVRETYTRTIGVEFTFLENRDARDWLQRTMETTQNRIELTSAEQLRILKKLTDAEMFEQFLHTKFIGAKRFSLEGGESVIPMLDMLIERSADLGVEEIVIGMAHRGRLNVMVNVLEMDVREIFSGFVDDKPEVYLGRGDVKYHLGFSTDRTTVSGRKVHLTLSFNPSHLEWVNPVVEGRVRAKQDRFGDEERTRVMPLLIHGDAAFVGQGVVAETLNLSRLRAYETGGTVHVVINNQIGFTTNPTDARSTQYCTDITRMLRCPVFHVNGEDPEAVAQVVRLATEYRQRFRSDVVIDLYCYRKYGHNEGDEPRFTQPLMYAAIDKKRSVRHTYIGKLVELGSITEAQALEMEEAKKRELEQALEEAKTGNFDLVPTSMQGVWRGYTGGRDRDTPKADTTVPRETLEMLLDRMTTLPEWFHPHARLKRFVLDKQREVLEKDEPMDWGTAENLALGSLLVQGVRIRLTGQDVRRGTFSHRHAVIFDTESGRRYTRLGHLAPDQAPLEIYDSPLSEAGVLGFEWGYSLDSPDALVMWEAQFGDFANTAQVIIDQFISSSEDKWHRLSGLTLLLPHGFEGQGPEHSSARLERWLMLCAEDNMQVVNLTTPAQLFHCLRRQVVRPWRKPLIILTPKSLLRHRRCVSKLEDLTTGGFKRIIADDSVDPKQVKRIVLCSGKVYYDILERREELERDDLAIVRLEQLYPIRPEEIREALAPYPDGTDLVWAQEEPWNMGAWFFIRARLPEIIGSRFTIRCIARPESASPATGSSAAHKLEQKMLLDAIFRDR
ncbi:MAG: 2-oxoglutarate dehydrogenase E1 component [Myxococcales bacterium]|nr:2-oxoglutarate dehydrogenase E1 component [Myxococcales bacterium]